jgi:trans-aconitate methyltransferase
VHARNLLMHLPGRLDALRRLLAAVRPGGWLALCEPDFNAQPISPPSAAWRRAWTLFCDAAAAGGWDPGYG